MNNIIVLVGWCFALSSLAAVKTSPSKSGDIYWQITATGKFATPDHQSDFWRTTENADGVLVYEACKSASKPIGSAKKSSDGSWEISQNSKVSFTAKTGALGTLKLLLPDGSQYGTGQRIRPVTCQNERPQSVVNMFPQSGERSFAQVTGDALHMEAARDKSLPTARSPAPFVPPLQDSTQYLPDGNTQICRNRNITASDSQGQRVRQLMDVPTLGPIPAIWPGALLQGRSYAKGSFTPIRIRRGGGTITLSGVNLTAGAQVSNDLDLVSEETVNDGIKKILSQKAVSTEAATFLPSVEIVYNDDQMAYSLGVDSRFLNGLNGALHVDSQSGNNYVLLRFTQVYYTASFEDPETAYAVFLDGDHFKDPENQIAPDNPPLLVKSVGYGRNVHVLVSSHYDANAVAMALRGVGNNEWDRTVNVAGKDVMLSQILKESTVSYYIQGGDAIAALGAMGTVNGVSNIYDTLKKVMADAKLAQVSDFSQGIPVTYNLSYLATRQPASMGFATAYNLRDCSTVPKKASSFWINITHVDDVATFELIGPSGNSVKIYDNNADVPRYIDLDTWIGNDHINDNYTLRVTLYNRGGPSGIDFQFGRENFGEGAAITGFDDATGAMKPSSVIWGPAQANIDANGTPSLATIFHHAAARSGAPFVHLETGWAIGNRMDYQIRFNRGTGAVNLVQRGW